MDPKTVNVVFNHDHETKNKQAFAPDAEGAKLGLGSIYLNKDVAGDAATISASFSLSGVRAPAAAA